MWNCFAPGLAGGSEYWSHDFAIAEQRIAAAVYKGLPLPFISYGGSNLAACLFGVGILVNIYRQAKLDPGNQKRITMQARMTPRI
ncbi:MAG: hypothetical protein DMF23_01490 [Verrucomicrobia bacterium]|nr:MAG: hypothetical protein DMF23_01490 [Verrucomicrobiota bacterium]